MATETLLPECVTAPLAALRKRAGLTLREAADRLSKEPGVKFSTHNRLLQIEQEGFDSISLEEAMCAVYGASQCEIRAAITDTKSLVN